jgi:hypothetical protein
MLVGTSSRLMPGPAKAPAVHATPAQAIPEEGQSSARRFLCLPQFRGEFAFRAPVPKIGWETPFQLTSSECLTSKVSARRGSVTSDPAKKRFYLIAV